MVWYITANDFSHFISVSLFIRSFEWTLHYLPWWNDSLQNNDSFAHSRYPWIAVCPLSANKLIWLTNIHDTTENEWGLTTITKIGFDFLLMETSPPGVRVKNYSKNHGDDDAPPAEDDDAGQGYLEFQFSLWWLSGWCFHLIFSKFCNNRNENTFWWWGGEKEEEDSDESK